MANEERESGNRRGRRRVPTEELDLPFVEIVLARNPEVVRAYHLSLWAMIPGLGLVLGPLALLLGLWLWRRNRRDPEFRGGTLILATVLLGLSLTVTHWVGLLLMVAGLRGQ